MKFFSIQTKNLTKIMERPLISDISFTAHSGEIHAIIGNNGEGKTLFAKLLAGVRPKTSGSILINNESLDITDVISAQKHGIYMLQQEQVLFPEQTVRDNIIAGNEKKLGLKNRFFSPSKKRLNQICLDYLKLFDLEHLNLDAPISSLSVMEKLVIQLCRILICKPKVLILDEPSTALTTAELRTIFDFMEDFKQNTAIILITHNYPLLMRYCDRVSVIDDGTITASFTRDDFTQPEFRDCITHLKMNIKYPRLPIIPGDELICFDHLSTNLLKDIHFSMHRGEIIGLAGLKIGEKHSFLSTLSEELMPKDGQIIYSDTLRRPFFSLISGDEANQALFMAHSIPFNIAVSNFRKVTKYGLFSKRMMKVYGTYYLNKLKIKDSDIHTRTCHLSTGTKQKIVIARSLFTQSNIYIYDEPTKNLDSTSRLDLYNILNALALDGASILLISSNNAELVGMCSRVILTKDGKQIGNYSTQYLSEEALSKELE
ncbi:MAG: ATP-binding cassette domain-containing protein [Hespellia sp.]|nr:ATP-binding cassette domain-containing protein [Hespellia sp.]